ncbi:MAG TPA: hypothetical protein VHP33_28620, partial [Polyangiaceae bacterium]|nr:hypothetical protein [Polyangiaceae bacterium]
MAKQESALAQALRDVPSGPTANIPAHTRALPMAHTTEAPVRTVESALREGRNKKPTAWTYLVQLASPGVLVGKSALDLSHSVREQADGTLAVAERWLALMSV